MTLKFSFKDRAFDPLKNPVIANQAAEHEGLHSMLRRHHSTQSSTLSNNHNPTLTRGITRNASNYEEAMT